MPDPRVLLVVLTIAAACALGGLHGCGGEDLVFPGESADSSTRTRTPTRTPTGPTPTPQVECIPEDECGEICSGAERACGDECIDEDDDCTSLGGDACDVEDLCPGECAETDDDLSGCCSSHDGVDCCTEDGDVLCNDGELSDVCSCEPN